MGKHKEKIKKSKKEKKCKGKKHKSRKSSSSDSSCDAWVEKDNYSSSEEDNKLNDKDTDKSSSLTSQREEWMSLSTAFASESNVDKRQNREEKKRLERERDQYNPRKHARELNPYWKDGGDGLPQFKKPSEKDEYDKKYVSNVKTTSNWRKKTAETVTKEEPKVETVTEVQTSSEILSDKELNILASKIVKAEIMGKTELVKELKKKLEDARKQRECSVREDHVILTETDSQGQSRPLKLQSTYGEYSGSQKKKRKIETHQDGQRVRYFPDDDKHSLQQMFENEKYNSVADQNKEFMNMASKVRKNDDLDDVFTDNIRTKVSERKADKKHVDKAIGEHHKVANSIDTCKFCIQSDKMPKHLMISLGETVFLSIPPHEPLTQGHCLIVPIRHVTCSTLLDENEWADVMNFRKALTKMYNTKNEDVIFFETASNLQRYPHMFIECVPLDKEEGDMAPIYFKKAIDECEAEWAQNKKLVSLKGRDVRRAIPKGLPYFFVSFGLEEGYAHVIEDEKTFPHNFAQEIIGGMLDLHHSKWRKPRHQSFEEQSQRVVEFSKEWSEFDCTKT